MKHFFIVTNQQKDEELALTGRVQDYILSRGGACEYGTIQKHETDGFKSLNPEELPEGCVSLGKVERLSNTEQPDVPYTDSEEFVGCQAWLLREDPVWKEFKLYVQRPEGGYLECHMG